MNTPRDVFALTVDELELSVRTYEAMQKAEIETVGQLLAHARGDLVRLGFTKMSLRELDELLGEHGLSLRPDA